MSTLRGYCSLLFLAGAVALGCSSTPLNVPNGSDSGVVDDVPGDRGGTTDSPSFIDVTDSGEVSRPDSGCRSDLDCDDGVFCNGTERCDPVRGCISSSPVQCIFNGDRCVMGVCAEASRQCVRSPRDEDRDGFSLVGCPGGGDCDDNDPGVNPRAAEVCHNGIDDDCNGQSDCADRACAGEPSCGQCIPTGAEAGNCSDGRDNDCNGVSDCADVACRAARECAMCAPTGPERDPMACADGRDNDCDGRTDCADSECGFFPPCAMCTPTGPEAGNCSDRRDNDCDGRTDCNDSDCARDLECGAINDTCATATLIALPGRATGTTMGARDDYQPMCATSTAPDVAFVFRNPTRQTVTIDTEGSGFDTMLVVYRADCTVANVLGCDDDSAGGTSSRVVLNDLVPGTYYIVVDGWNTASGAFTLNLSLGSTEVCDNRIDDDRDGLIDCADPDCRTSMSCGMCVPTGPENQGNACGDRRDNDCDGRVDCADTDCVSSPFCCRPTGRENTPAECRDGRDNDCDGRVDCADSTCQSTSVCCMPTSQREIGVAACTDGRDNDCDGVADCADSDCNPSRGDESECCNGRDDNANGVIDEFACACESARDCAGVGHGAPFPSDTCWVNTYRLCGPRCDLLGGDAFCSEQFSGARCDRATGECR